MTEFSKVMKDWRRMCDSYDECDNCSLVHLTGGCRAIFEDFAQDTDWNCIADVVEQWAKKHPLVYPTWREYLTSIGVLPKQYCLAIGKNEDYGFDFQGFEEGVKLTNTRISEDIAKKLGIKPKEIDK